MLVDLCIVHIHVMFLPFVRSVFSKREGDTGCCERGRGLRRNLPLLQAAWEVYPLIKACRGVHSFTSFFFCGVFFSSFVFLFQKNIFPASDLFSSVFFFSLPTEHTTFY